MDGLELPEAVHQWVTTVLVWIGFGSVVGLLARAILPGKDQGGAVATILMGIGGTVVGLGTLSFFWDGHRVTPVSLVGFFVALGGAFTLVFFHRLLSGSLLWNREMNKTTAVPATTRRHYSRETTATKDR